MPISIAVPYQNTVGSGSYISTTYTANAGLLLMASVYHTAKTYISTITWDGNPLSVINDYSNIENEYKAISVYGLYNFSYGTKTFTCVIPGNSGELGLSLVALNSVGATYNSAKGVANPGDTAYFGTTINKNYPSNDMAMFVGAAAGALTGIGTTGSIVLDYGDKMTGQYGINASTSIPMGQHTTGTDPLACSWVTFVLQEYIAPPASEVFSPIWFY